jgi:hypothetical protein
MIFPMPFPSAGSSGGEEVPTPDAQEGTSSAPATTGQGELPRSPTADNHWEGSSREPQYPSEQSSSGWSETPLNEGETLQDPWSQSPQEDAWHVDAWSDSDTGGGDGDGW